MGYFILARMPCLVSVAEDILVLQSLYVLVGCVCWGGSGGKIHPLRIEGDEGWVKDLEGGD